MYTLDSETQDATELAVTKPLYLVELGFNTKIYLSSRETYSWAGHTWLAADVTVRFGTLTNLEIFNEALTLGKIIISQGTTGRSVNIYQAYQKFAGGYTDPKLKFSGEMGPAAIDSFVSLKCKPRPPNKTPRLYVVEPVFNHTPKAGTVIKTATEIITLETN